MKLSELLRLLKSRGARLERHGKEHDIWTRGEGKSAEVPRHAKELKTGTLNRILKDLQISK